MFDIGGSLKRQFRRLEMDLDLWEINKSACYVICMSRKSPRLTWFKYHQQYKELFCAFMQLHYFNYFVGVMMFDSKVGLIKSITHAQNTKSQIFLNFLLILQN